MSIMRGTGGGRVIPARDPEREAMSSGSGPVVTYQMSPEELEEYKKKTGAGNMARGRKAQEPVHQSSEVAELREERDAWRGRTEELKQAVAELQEERALLLQTNEKAASPKPVDTRFEEIGIQIGQLVAEKNAAYGDSFAKTGAFLRLLYPDGIRPEQYGDALSIVRVFDKLMRLATRKGAFGESPYRDIAGYGILGAAIDGEVSEP